MRKFKAGKSAVGKRADVFVAGHYPAFSRSSLEALFDNQQISLNDQPIKPSQKVKKGDVVMVDETLFKKQPPEVKLPIIYEDSNVIVIDKPAGILTHSKGALNLESSVASFIKPKLNPKLTGNRAGIVHRLDRGTSGVIIAAKNRATLSFLQKQFSKRNTKKKYLAIVEGVPEPEEAIIKVPILRNPAKPQTFIAARLGKSAETTYKVLKIFTKGNNRYSLLELTPKTGRTHQLRVHLKYIGHPIVGDGVYGKGGDEMMLHAKSLELTLPGGERRVFVSPIPARIRKLADV